MDVELGSELFRLETTSTVDLDSQIEGFSHEDDSKLPSLEHLPRAVYTKAVPSPDRRLLFVGAREGLIFVWDLISMTVRKLIRDPRMSGEILCLAMSSCGRFLAAAFRDYHAFSGTCTIKVFNIAGLTSQSDSDGIKEPGSGEGEGTGEPGSKEDHTTMDDDVDGLAYEVSSKPIRSGAQSLCFDPSQADTLLVSTHEFIRFLDWSHCEWKGQILGYNPDDPLNSACTVTRLISQSSITLGLPMMIVSERGSQLCTHVVPTGTLYVSSKIKRKGHSIELALNNTETAVATADSNGIVSVFSLPLLSLMCRLRGHSAAVQCVEFHSHSDDWLASGSADRTCRIWHLGKAWCILILRWHDRPVSGLAWSQEGDTLWSCSSDGTLRGWRTPVWLDWERIEDLCRAWLSDCGVKLSRDVVGLIHQFYSGKSSSS